MFYVVAIPSDVGTLCMHTEYIGTYIPVQTDNEADEGLRCNFLLHKNSFQRSIRSIEAAEELMQMANK